MEELKAFDEWIAQKRHLSEPEHLLAKAAFHAAWKSARIRFASICDDLPVSDPKGAWFNNDMCIAAAECAAAIRGA